MHSSNGNVRLLPRVREHETNEELFWQVELPATDRVKLSLDGRILTVRVVHPAQEGRDMRIRPETAAD
jgi:hypothetical protein